jgi:hypothetical protein
LTAIWSYGDESVSMALEEVDAERWRDDVYTPDIINQPGKLYKKPGTRCEGRQGAGAGRFLSPIEFSRV